MRTISIIGTDMHGKEDWWDIHFPEQNPWMDGGRLRFDCAHRPSMDNQYHELAVIAEIDGIAVGLRGNRAAGFEHIPLFSQVIQECTLDFGGRPTPTLMPFIDTVGMGDMANYDDPEGEPKLQFDFANDRHLERFWAEYLGPFYEIFPERRPGVANPIVWERTPDGRLPILWWGINSDNGHGIVNQVHAQRLLDLITKKMEAAGYGAPAFIVDHTWLQHQPKLNVYGVHGWFDPAKKDGKGRLLSDVDRAHTITRHNGVAVVLMVPGFIDPPPHFKNPRIVDRQGGDVPRRVLELARKAKADYVFIESYNNRTEGAGLYRTNAWGARELDTVREHIHLTKEGDLMEAVTKQPLLDFVLFDALLPGSAPNTYALPWNEAKGEPDPSSDRVFSLQKDGTVQTRSNVPNVEGGILEWESGRIIGDKLVFNTEGAAIKVFGLIRGV